jgi:uncharacterized protein
MHRLFVAAILAALSLNLFATEPNPSPRQRILVEKLLEATSMNRAGVAMIDAMFAQIEKQTLDAARANGNRPEDIAEAMELFGTFRAKASKIDFAGLMQEAYIRIYSKYFTESELEDLLAFHSTPTGRKSIEVMPDLMREGMEAGVRELAPKIDQVMSEAMTEQEKKRPWRRAMADIRNVATALEAYALDHDELYPLGDYASLEGLLTPDYLTGFPDADPWEHAYAYVVSPDRKRYRLVSAGADSIFDWDSRRILGNVSERETKTRWRDRLEDDIILADLAFVQAPVQAKAENDR